MRIGLVGALLGVVVQGCGGGRSAPDSGMTSSDAAMLDAQQEPCGDGTCAADETATTCCADCGVCSEVAYVDMETGSATGVTGGALTPGGLADTHATFVGAPFTEVVFSINVLEQPSVPGTSYFWAQQFFFENTTQGGYTGLQTGGICGGQLVGKMAVFSIWEALAGDAGAGATCEVFGGEGTGYKCCKPFEWREDVTYRLQLREVSADRWELVVGDPSSLADFTIGTITTNATWGRVLSGTAGFTEYFGTVASCSQLPHAKARFHAPRVNGAGLASMNAGTYGTCVAQATSTCIGTACQ